MAKAIEAALSAKSITSPNPWVGALLEHQGQIINVSSTKKYGAAHAEAQTLQGKQEIRQGQADIHKNTKIPNQTLQEHTQR